MQYDRLSTEEQIKIVADRVLELERECFKQEVENTLNTPDGGTPAPIDPGLVDWTKRARRMLRNLQGP